MAVSPREDAHVDVARFDVVEALVDYALVASHVGFHRDARVAHLVEHENGGRAVFLQVLVGRRDVDALDHWRAHLHNDSRRDSVRFAR